MRTVVMMTLLLTWCVPVFAADEPGVEPPKQAPLAVVITELRKEASRSWRADHRWPRVQSNFAAEKNWSLPNDQIVTALTRKLDENPAVDAYIKWQLLSFAPDFSKVPAQRLNHIVARAPKPLNQPEPSLSRSGSGQGMTLMMFGGQTNYVRDLDPVVGDGVAALDPKVGTLNSGQSLGQRRAMMQHVAARANAGLDSARATIDTANQPVHAYRDAVIERLPTDDGLRFAVMLKDVRDRLAAGDPTFADVLDRTAEAAKTLAADPTLTTKTRNTLVQWARTLGKMRTHVVQRVTVDSRGRLDYDRTTLAPRDEDVQFIINRINQTVGGDAAP